MQRVATFQAVKPSAARCIAVRPTRRPMVVSATAVPASVAVPVKGADGADQGSETLALKVASSDTASGLVHRYVVMVQQNARRGTASTLRRSEVRGGGKKPYAQKGTGNARRGSSTSPLFPGGGVTFGPKPTDWTIKMNKKERRLALATALQSSASDMVAIESLADQVTDKKTKSLLSVLSNVGADPASQKVLVVLSEPRDHVELAGRNVQRLKFNYASALSVYDVLNADVIVAEKAALAHIQETYGANAAAVAAA